MIGIIPMPYSIHERGGYYTFPKTVTVNRVFNETALQLARYLEQYGINVTSKDEDCDVSFILNNELKDEAYKLNITERGIVIEAGSSSGAFYATQTIRQLIDESEGDFTRLPCVSVEDKPRFGYRSFMLDDARHFFGVDAVCQFLDMMAYNKLNNFHWHLSDDQGWRIEIKKYPLLTEIGSIRSSTMLHPTNGAIDNNPYGKGMFYTQDQIRYVVTYAEKLHINIVPEIDMPGHTGSAISAYPYLSCEQKPIEVYNKWGVNDTIGCVGNEKFMEFAKDVLKEIIQLFPSKYIHIGGDEAPKVKWKKCPKCQAKIKELGLADEEELQGWFNNEIVLFLEQYGKKAIGWNEILYAKKLSDNIVAQWWTGNAVNSGVKKWLKGGNEIILAKNSKYMDNSYTVCSLKKLYNTDLRSEGLAGKYESQVMGIEAPQWTEYIRTKRALDVKSYPRLQALAEINWTTFTQKNYENFLERLKSQENLMKKSGINYASREIYSKKGLPLVIDKIMYGDWRQAPDREVDKNDRYNKY